MTKQFIYQAARTTRQAHAQFFQRRAQYAELLDGAEAQLRIVRQGHPGLGLQKAWYQLQPVGISRERFCYEMTWRGYALPIKRSFMRTTRSTTYRFPNLVKGLIVNAINQVWQSDTTYYRIGERFYYLTFIMDVYSRQIVGYCVSQDLLARANVKALRRAVRNVVVGQGDLTGLIFHSDGGVQYRSNAFVKELRSQGVSSSMCDVALDNAFAERINGIIKQEYLRHWLPNNFSQLQQAVKRAVGNYNEQRPHGQLPGRRSPLTFIREWQAGVAECRYGQVIKDGQGPNEVLDQQLLKSLPKAGMYAEHSRPGLLPSSVIILSELKTKSRAQ